MKTSKYQPDDFTRRHLHAWFERGLAPCDFRRNEACEANILKFLAKQDPIDAEYMMGQGWTAIFYRATQNL